MEAIRVHAFGGPEVLKLEEIPDLHPGPNQVVVRIRAIGINPVETYIRAGKYGPVKFPYTPGSDSAGDVEETGPAVQRFKPGQRVYTAGALSGAYAQKALCDQSTVHPLPDGVSFEQGAAVGIPYATAHRAMFLRGQARAGETMLVHGASGGVGTAAVQFGHAFGLTVIGTAGTEKGLALAKEQGARHVLDHRDSNYLQQLKDMTGGSGVNLILEMAAHLNLGKDLPLLARNGRVVVVGSRGPVEINPRDGMGRDADIRAMTLMNATLDELRGIHVAIVAGLELRTLRPVVGRTFPLAEAARAHEAVLESGSYGKIVLIP